MSATQSPPRVLLVDDEVRLALLLQQSLSREGYDVTVAHDGLSGLALASGGGFDAVVLDIMLPGLSGYRVLQRLRAEGNDVPVLMLSAKDGEYDEADAFELGADDYVTKPFSSVVLKARMQALLRRRAPVTGLLQLGGLRVDPAQHRCWVDEREVVLTAREFELLQYLLERRDRVVSKAELLDEVWEDPDASPNVVEVCMRQLRQKVGPEWVRTIRNVGYRLAEPDA